MHLPKNYYPYYYRPIHEVHDWCYVRHLARAALRGETIPAIPIDTGGTGDLQDGALLGGTHRSAANDLLEALGHERLIPYEDRHDYQDWDLEAGYYHHDHDYR